MPSERVGQPSEESAQLELHQQVRTSWRMGDQRHTVPQGTCSVCGVRVQPGSGVVYDRRKRSASGLRNRVRAQAWSGSTAGSMSGSKLALCTSVFCSTKQRSKDLDCQTCTPQFPAGTPSLGPASAPGWDPTPASSPDTPTMFRGVPAVADGSPADRVGRPESEVRVWVGGPKPCDLSATALATRPTHL